MIRQGSPRMPCGVRTQLYTGQEHRSDFHQTTVKAAQGIQIAAVKDRTATQTAIQNGEQVNRIRTFVCKLLHQRYSFLRNTTCHLTTRLMTALHQHITLHVTFTQMGKINERHPAEKEHQQEISKRASHVLRQ